MKLIKVVVAAMTVLLFVAGCSAGDNTWKPINSDNGSLQPLWEHVALQPPAQTGHSLAQISGDVIVQEGGQALAVLDWPDDDRQLLLVDYADSVVMLTILDLNSLGTEPVGSILLQGEEPVVADYHYPHILLQADDGQGVFQWLLVDIEQWDIVWQHSSTVPQGLRRRPVWHNGESWLLGPVSGPGIKDVLTGEFAVGKLLYTAVNPLVQPWPLWSGPAQVGSLFAYPATEQGQEVMALADTKSGQQWAFPGGRQIAWAQCGGWVAWIHQDRLYVFGPDGEVRQPLGDVPASSPMWSQNSLQLFFIAGEEDYLGVTWKEVASWQPGEEPEFVRELPAALGRWRLVAAAEQALLAVAGTDSGVMTYMDLVNDRNWDLAANGNDSWLFHNGNLFAQQDDDLVRISPGGSKRTLLSADGELGILTVIETFLVFTIDGQVQIKQVVLD